MVYWKDCLGLYEIVGLSIEWTKTKTKYRGAGDRHSRMFVGSIYRLGPDASFVFSSCVIYCRQIMGMTAWWCNFSWVGCFVLVKVVGLSCPVVKRLVGVSSTCQKGIIELLIQYLHVIKCLIPPRPVLASWTPDHYSKFCLVSATLL